MNDARRTLRLSILALAAAAPSWAAQQQGPKGVPPLPGPLPAAAPGLPSAPGVPLPGAPGLIEAADALVRPVVVPAVPAAPERPGPAAAVGSRALPVREALDAVPRLSAASPSDAKGAGESLEAAMTGEALAPSAGAAVPAAAEPSAAAALAQAVAAGHSAIQRIRAEVGKVIVGQREMVDAVLMAMIGREHVLLEGVPGVAKTQTAKAFASAVQGRFQRFQGTPDMMPSDLLGSVILQEDPGSGRKEFVTRKGPVFTDIFLVDEINRMQPRTQSALLEAMGEKQVTIGGETHALSPAFTVLATQNPVEQDGTYRLPEAQLDRFMFKVLVTQPRLEELREIGRRNESAEAKPKAEPVATLEELDALRRIAQALPITEELEDYIGRVATAASADPEIKKVVQYHVYTRAAIYLRQAARLHALLGGRSWVGPADVRAVAPMVLRHRIVLTYNARQSVEEVIMTILDRTPVRMSEAPAKAGAADKAKRKG